MIIYTTCLLVKCRFQLIRKALNITKKNQSFTHSSHNLDYYYFLSLYRLGSEGKPRQRTAGNRLSDRWCDEFFI